MSATSGLTHRFLASAAALALAAFASAGALAQDDLPGRVGRLADVAGRVYIATEQRAEDWLDAYRNDTVTSGDNLWVSGDGRAEIDYGGGQLRLAGDTNVHLARLDDAILALFVAQGRVIVRVRVLEPGEAARIDTPNTQIALTRPGLYRIDVSPDRTRTELVVREGEATASFATGVQQVLPGQTALLDGPEPALANVRNGYYVDGFDTWSAERDRRYERSRSTTYVSRQMIGYADLDEYGRWESEGEFGALWYPSGVEADWAPYRDGRWSWVGGWGWTWVDDAPWGYAPFHYGRWVHHRGRWAWAPGGWTARPVWSPAMVAWYGGTGWSVSASYGAPVYGWVPLAWGEPFNPWWGGCSQRCWARYNRPYAVNLAERPQSPPTRYANWSAPGGATAVPGAVFTGRRPVRPSVVDVRPGAFGSAPILGRAPQLDKPRPGKVPTSRPATAPQPAAALQSRPMRLPATMDPSWEGRSEGWIVRPDPQPRPSAALPRAGTGAQAPSAGQGVRPPARAPVTPGTWGVTGQPDRAGAQGGAPSSTPGAGVGTLQREARPPQGAVPVRPQPQIIGPAPSAPAQPAPTLAPRPRGAAPPQLQRPGVYAPPSSVNPAGAAPVPYSAPPSSIGGAAVPQVAPSPRARAGPPGQAGQPPGRGGAPPPGAADDGGGASDPPMRPVPRALPR